MTPFNSSNPPSEALCPGGWTGITFLYTATGCTPSLFPPDLALPGCFQDPGCRNLNATRGCSDSKDRTGPQRLQPVGRGDCGPVVVSPNDWLLQWPRPRLSPPPPQGVLRRLSQRPRAAHPTDPGPETCRVPGGCRWVPPRRSGLGSVEGTVFVGWKAE